MNIIPKIKKIFDPQNLVLFLFTVIALSMAWNTADAIQRNYELQESIARLQQEIDILELENTNLTFNIEYYKSDTYLELAAREKFNKAQAGERVLLLPKDLDVNFTEESEIIPEASESSNFQRWLNFLGGKPSA